MKTRLGRREKPKLRDYFFSLAIINMFLSAISCEPARRSLLTAVGQWYSLLGLLHIPFLVVLFISSAWCWFRDRGLSIFGFIVFLICLAMAGFKEPVF